MKATARVQRWLPEAKTIEVEAHMAVTCGSYSFNGRLLTTVQIMDGG